MKLLKKLKILLFVLVFVLTIPLINYFVLDTGHSYTRIMFHELYNQENLDTLFIGASRTYRYYDTELYDSIVGSKSFNAGTSAQLLDASYYILLDVAEKHNLKTVYLDFPMNLVSSDYSDQSELSSYIVFDYMRFSKHKLNYFFDITGRIDALPLLFPASRSTVSLSNIKENLSIKRTAAYKNYEYDFVTYENEAYIGNGFVYSYDIAKNFDGDVTFYSEHPISKDALNYLDLIVAFCKENNITLVLTDGPLPEETLKKFDYRSYASALAKYADENEIEFWEFNSVNEDFMTFSPDEFSDHEHLNGKGATHFTEKFSELAIDYSDGEFDHSYYFEEF